jgi:hypothetical protein
MRLENTIQYVRYVGGRRDVQNDLEIGKVL